MKRTSKYVGFSLLIVAFIMCMSACTGKKKSIMITDFSSGGVLSSITIDVHINDDYKKCDASNRLTIAMENEPITGTYEESSISTFYNLDTDYYETTGVDGKKIEFFINRKNKKLVGFFIFYRGEYETTNENKSYEECFQIAKNKLQEFDDGDYVQIYKENHMKPVYDPSAGNVYSFYFNKLIGGKPTDIIVWIDVNTDGKVVVVDARQIYEFKNTDARTINSYVQDENSLIGEIKERLLSETPDKNREDLSFTLLEKKFCKLKDGRLGLLCDVEVASDESNYKDYVQVLKVIN